jgi:uncharacterized protein (DUF58 family)
MSRNRSLLRSRNRPPSLDGTSNAELLRRLDLDVSRKLDGMLQGDYRGLVPGHGTELGETRQYQWGDDVRRIDWNVTARANDVHIRETIADRELECWVLADLSPSPDFGTADCEKRDLAVAAVAAVGFLTARMGNRIGGLLLDNHGLRTVPARTGRPHLHALLHQVVNGAAGDGGGPTDLAPAIHRLGALTGRRGLAVVVSDFLSPPGWQRPLRALAARHDVLAVEIVDPRELDLPNVGLLEIIDPESGERREIQTSSRKLRRRYSAAARAQRDDIARSIREAGADHLVLSTDRDWLLDLVRFVSLRRRRLESLPRVTS